MENFNYDKTGSKNICNANSNCNTNLNAQAYNIGQYDNILSTSIKHLLSVSNQNNNI